MSSEGDEPTESNEALNLRYVSLERQELEVMQRLKKDHEDNAIEYFNHPNPPQEKLLESWMVPHYKVFTFTGANRIGKTTIGTIIALCILFGEFPWNGVKLRFPHNRPRKVRYIGQDWEKHIAQVAIPALNKWWPKNRLLKRRKNNMGIYSLWLDVSTGSTLEIMSNKQESELHEGWDGDLIVYDEPPKRAVRVANARGLVDRQGRELFCMTLLKEAWIDREVIKAVDEKGRPDNSVVNIHGEIYENVGYGITQAGVDQFAKTLTDEEKDARLKGIPSYMSGLIYGDYKRELHLRRRILPGGKVFKLPLDWLIDIAIDVHPREKQAVLFVATDPFDRKYAFHEIWDNGDGTFVAEEIVRYAQLHSLRVNRIIIDPLSKGDKNNPNTTYDKVEEVLARHDMILETASKDKTSGIILVKAALMGPNNEPSFFILDDMVRTIFEIEGYMWDKETQKPVDKDDHMMENLYRIMLLDTKYEPMQNEDFDDFEETKRNPITGY